MLTAARVSLLDRYTLIDCTFLVHHTLDLLTAVAKKTRILDVLYNASNNELVRTKTLVKSAVVQVDATPFRQFYEQHYGQEVGKKKKGAAKKEATEGEVRTYT